MSITNFYLFVSLTITNYYLVVSLTITNYYLVVSLTLSDQGGLVDLNIGSNINYIISGSVYTVLALAIERYLTLSGHSQGNKVRYSRVTR